MPRGPLARSYPGAVALVVFSLIPYLVLTAAVFPLADVIGKSLRLSPHVLDLTLALSSGAYATGTVLAVQFAVHLPARRMLVAYEALFVAASVLAAWAPSGGVFIGAFITEGLCTSLMLIAAVPPLVTRWPADKMPVTGTVMNLCIFGAVAIGPTVGAAQLQGGSWRPLFWGVAGVAALALVFSLLTFEDDPPQGRDAPWNLVALGLAVVGCGAAFLGAGELQAALSPSATAIAPLAAGLAMIVGLVVYEYRLKNPLMPMRQAATTVPVAGIFTALTASSAGFGVMELLLEGLKKSMSPTDIALVFIPEFVGAISAAGLFGALFRSRFTPLLALGGLLAITAAAALAIVTVAGGGPAVAAVTGLLGLGLGAAVSPALFLAGFSLRSPLLQRVFAMIELLRGMTAFLVAPILIVVATAISSRPAAGLIDALWVCVGLAAVGTIGGTALYLGGRRSLAIPDIEAWQGDGEPAWESPPLFARLRRAAPAPGNGEEPKASNAA